MSQLGTKRVSLLRRFAEGVFVGLGISLGLVGLQLLMLTGMLTSFSLGF